MLDFFPIRGRPLGFLVGKGAIFFQQLKIRFLSDKVKAFIFCNNKKYFV